MKANELSEQIWNKMWARVVNPKLVILSEHY